MSITLSEVVSKAHAYNIKQNPAALEGLFDAQVNVNFSDAVKTGENVAKTVARAGMPLIKPLTQINETSLSEVTRTANVEPRVMLEESLRNLPNLDKWFMALTNLYSAYYLQAVNLSGTVGKVSVLSVLERFNPNRQLSLQPILQSLATESMLDYGYKLPNYKTLGTEDFKLIRAPKAALEAAESGVAIYNGDSSGNGNTNTGGTGKKDASKEKTDNQKERPDNNDPSGKEVVSNLQKIQDMDSLAVGRLLSVDVMIDGKKFIVPVAVRVRPMAIPSLIMRELVALGDIRDSWKERWHRWRAGELSLVGDVILQNDRIKNRKKLMALDKQGIYREMLARRRNNALVALQSGKVSIGAAASFIIISKQTAREVERRTGVPIDNREFINRTFSENSAMMLLIVDTEWERVQTFTRGINGSVDYTFRQLEGMAKGNGPDIMEIMKAYTLGNSPRF